MKGDYYYYLTDEKVEDSFRRGSLYRITSYDTNANVYYVYTVGKQFVTVVEEPEKDANGYVLHYHDEDGNIIEIDPDTYDYMTYDVDGLGWKYQKLDFADGYRSVDGSTSYEKTNAKDTYVLICNPIDDWTKPNTDWTASTKNYLTGGDYAPIIVYTGRVSAKWHVEGFRVTGTGDNSFVFVGVDFNKIVGFDADQYDISYVLFLHYDYTKAAYDSADADGWYLLGASNFEATVFNWYNGEIETKTAVNKDLKMGYSYPSINGVIVNDAPYAAWELNGEIPGAYQWQWEINSRSTPHYLFGCSDHIAGYAGFVNLDSEDGDTYKAAFNKYFDKENFSKEVISAQKGLTIKVKDLVNSVKVFLVEADADDEKIIEVERVDAAALSMWARDNKIDLVNLYFWWIMDKDGNVVVYINRNAGKLVKYEDYQDEVGTGLVDVKSSGAFDTDKLWFGNSKNTEADTDEALISGKVIGTFDGKTDLLKTLDSIALRWTYVVDTEAAEKADAEPTVRAAEEEPAEEAEEEAGANWIAVHDIENLSHYEVDVKDFHFGRYGYCEKENFWFKLNGKRIYDSVDSNGKACVITEVYDAQDHDEDTCDLIQELTLNLGGLEVEYPDYDIMVVNVSEVPENAKIIDYCDGGCACIVAIYDEEIVTGDYALTKEQKAAVVDEANEILAENAETQVFTIEFRDSSDTTYKFEVTLYIAATVKAETDKYGHTSLVFDKWVLSVDFTDAFIGGENYGFASNQPEYKDRFVTDENRADATLPDFDLVTFEYDY